MIIYDQAVDIYLINICIYIYISCFVSNQSIYVHMYVHIHVDMHISYVISVYNFEAENIWCSGDALPSGPELQQLEPCQLPGPLPRG